MALRVLVSLTHANERWCSKVLRHELTVGFVMRVIVRADRQRGLFHKGKGKAMSIVKNEEDTEDEVDVMIDDAAQTLDRLCLALGLLTNLVQVVEEAKFMLLETRTLLARYQISLTHICICRPRPILYPQKTRLHPCMHVPTRHQRARSSHEGIPAPTRAPLRAEIRA
jgi:hypothetical protein